jgi:predicted dehydrogenase
MEQTIQAGIIGCGGIAQNKHLPSIQKLGFVKLTAFCDVIAERAEKMAKQYGTPDARIYTDYRELLDKEKDVEAVHVLTPNRSHSEISVAAMEAGRHVLCEKPMAINSAEAGKMLDCAKRTGKILTIGYQNRFRPESRFLKEACETGMLGDIYYATAHAIRRRAVPTWGVFLDEYAQGGGPLIDIGTHALDLTLWMMNNYKPKRVLGSVYRKLADQTNQGNAFGPWDPKLFTVEDSAFGTIIMEDGATIVLESSWALNTLDVDEAKTTLCGTEAGADMKGSGLRLNGVRFGRPYIEEVDVTPTGVAFFEGSADEPCDVMEARTFYNAIMNGGSLIVKPEQAIIVTQILEAIYESAKTGKTIEF